MRNSKTTAALGAVLLLVGGCNAPAVAEASLPDGETDLSCAAMIYAATSLLQDQGVSAGDFAGFGDYLAVMTKYGTAHAESKGIDANAALAEIRLEALRMTGQIPGGPSVIPSTEGIVSRAKACMGS
jgi:hypothetical protein